MRSRKITIDVRGAAEIFLNGKHLRQMAPKSRALLAVLALSPSHSCSRSFLSTLFWCEKSQQRANGNLRAELVKIRRLVGKNGKILISTSDRLHLDKDRIEIKYPELGCELLSGIDINEESFEDWLSRERANFENRRNRDALINGGNNRKEFKISKVPVISVLPFQMQLSDPKAYYLSSMVSDLIQEDIRNYGISEIFDYNAVADSCWGNTTTPVADLYLSFNTYLVDDNYYLFCKLMEPLERKVISSPSILIPNDKANILRGTKIPRFINQVVDAVSYALKMYYAAHQGTPVLSNHAVFAIHEIQKGRKGDLALAERLLDNAYEETRRGIYLAWKSYLYTYLFGERLVSNDISFHEKLKEMARLAVEKEPNNPLVLSLVGHVKSFIFHDYEKSLHNFDSALEQQPKMAICYDLSARTQVYVANAEQAEIQSRYALKLGRNAQYRSNIEVSCYMSSFINGNHQDVIKYASNVLEQRPNFAAVLRYMAASYGLQDNISEGRAVLKKLKRIEPDFNIGLLHSNDYPIAGTKSREMLIAGITRLET